MDVTKRTFWRDLIGCETLCLVDVRIAKHLVLAVCMVFAVLVFGARNANAATPTTIDCTNGQTPTMTVEIYNNSTSP